MNARLTMASVVVALPRAPQAVLIHARDQRPAGHAERSRDLGLVTAVLLEGFDDPLALEIGDLARERTFAASHHRLALPQRRLARAHERLARADRRLVVQRALDRHRRLTLAR